MDHIFFNLLELDPEIEEDSILMGVLNGMGLKHKMHVIALFLHEYLRSTCLNLPILLAVEVKSL